MIENFYISNVHLPNVWKENEGEEESRHKTADVCKVVDPGKHSEGEQKGRNGRQLGKGFPRPLEDLPALKKLHEQTGQDAKLAACRTNLSPNSFYVLLRPMATTAILFLGMLIYALFWILGQYQTPQKESVYCC